MAQPEMCSSRNAGCNPMLRVRIPCASKNFAIFVSLFTSVFPITQSQEVRNGSVFVPTHEFWSLVFYSLLLVSEKTWSQRAVTIVFQNFLWSKVDSPDSKFFVNGRILVISMSVSSPRIHSRRSGVDSTRRIRKGTTSVRGLSYRVFQAFSMSLLSVKTINLPEKNISFSEKVLINTFQKETIPNFVLHSFYIACNTPCELSIFRNNWRRRAVFPAVVQQFIANGQIWDSFASFCEISFGCSPGVFENIARWICTRWLTIRLQAIENNRKQSISGQKKKFQSLSEHRPITILKITLSAHSACQRRCAGASVGAAPSKNAFSAL